MSLTRKALKGMSLTDEQVDTIIELHTEVVDGLKEQIKVYKADADSLPEVQKQLDGVKAELESAKKDSWKVKYDAIKEEFDAYKTEQSNKATHAAKEAAYRGLLKDAGIAEKRIAAVLKVSDVDSVELDDSGKVKDAKTLTESIKSEWADFIQTTETQGAPTPTPPDNPTDKGAVLNNMSLSERMKYANEHPKEYAELSKK